MYPGKWSSIRHAEAEIRMKIRTRASCAGSLLAALALTSAAVPSSAVAQEEAVQEEAAQGAPAVADSTAALSGEVLSALTGEPMIGAHVFLRRARRGAVTDSAGEFRIESLPAGRDTIAVWYAAVEPQFTELDLVPDRLTSAVFLVSERMFEVADITVEVRAFSARRQRLERRKRFGNGVYITRQMIEEAKPVLMTDMLRGIPRVEVEAYRFATEPVEVRIGYGATACIPMYFLDGTEAKNFTLDEVRPIEVEELEIYRGASETPPEFRKMGNTCGAIVVWTRGSF